MKQYIEMVQAIKEKGVYKPAAREGMPGTTSLFGYQFRHNLAEGFPALTTKQLYWKGVVIELIWFLSGDTNIKFLDQHGVRKMWHEDAYNYYVKIASANTGSDANGIYYDNGDETLRMFTFEEFCDRVKGNSIDQLKRNFSYKNYVLGDCGMQYGKLWREWRGELDKLTSEDHKTVKVEYESIDQIKDLIEGLKKNPMSRRHILTAWNPATLDDMALNACHAMAQWNCRPLTLEERVALLEDKGFEMLGSSSDNDFKMKVLDAESIPQHYLDCQMYQRSADVFLGVPLNIASYALLTEILCKICNMVPGEMIYTYGDVHIYDNHQDAINEQLSREERDLPTLKINNGFVVEFDNIWNQDIDKIVEDIKSGGWQNIFQLENYDPHPTIKAKLSTGLR